MDMSQIKKFAVAIKDAISAHPLIVRSAIGLAISLGILTIADAQADAVSAAIVALVMALSAGAKPAAVAVNNRIDSSPVVQDAEADEITSDEIEEILADLNSEDE